MLSKQGFAKIHVGQPTKAYAKLLLKYGEISRTPFVKQAAYKISHRQGKT